MKISIRATFAGIFLAMVFFSYAIAGPKMSISEPEFDFGFAPQQSKISHDFWLHSTGDDTLKIIKVNPG